MSIHNTRRERLKWLIEHRYGGNQTAFGDAIDRSQNYVSRIVSGKPPARGGKNLGEELARKFETMLDLEPGWFDRAETPQAREKPPPYAVAGPDNYPALIALRIAEADEAVQLAVLNMIEAFLADGMENGAKRKRRRASHRKE